MRTELYNGLTLLIIGMTLVFLFLGILTFVVFLLKKLSQKKEIVISIQANPTSDIQNLERIAVISAALMYLQSRHSSLTNSHSGDNFSVHSKYFNWRQ